MNFRIFCSEISKIYMRFGKTSMLVVNDNDLAPFTLYVEANIAYIQ